MEGILIEALRSGAWLLLDEINLGSAETLQRLAGLLEGGSITLTERGDTTPIPRHAGFRLFAAMNPATDFGKRDLPASLRYGVQLATALFLLWISPLPALAPGLWVWLLLLIAATAVINFTNFMDGLDGLVAGCMAVLFAVAGLWPLVGALLGFLLWNWSPAKVFMGDVGSTFLGAVFAGVVLQQTSFSAALALLLVATPLLADACLCVPRRLLAGQRIFQAHRLHLFQRLHQAGWCHAHVSSLYIAATAVLAIAHLAGGLAWVIGFALAVLLIGVWLDQHVAVPFAVASKS
jgi:UDP-N-acetylmuramyl pentapeptide phosphotransferase/UDP-N-acetylglucosamine-1-phosphate transferase